MKLGKHENLTRDEIKEIFQKSNVKCPNCNCFMYESEHEKLSKIKHCPECKYSFISNENLKVVKNE